MPPTAKKTPPRDAVSLAFASAEEGPALADEDRAALAEAARDPRWTRVSRGDAFERLACDGDE